MILKKILLNEWFFIDIFRFYTLNLGTDAGQIIYSMLMIGIALFYSNLFMFKYHYFQFKKRLRPFSAPLVAHE